MQNTKDSFYIALRNRLAVVNPARVLTIRAVQRPSILMEEAEAPMMELLNNSFVIRWTTVASIADLPGSLVSLDCEIHYASSGSQTNAGLDRGRELTKLDEEILIITQPPSTLKYTYATTPAVALQTNIFWTDIILGPMQTVRDQLMRTAKTTIFSFEETVEL